MCPQVASITLRVHHLGCSSTRLLGLWTCVTSSFACVLYKEPKMPMRCFSFQFLKSMLVLPWWSYSSCGHRGLWFRTFRATSV